MKKFIAYILITALLVWLQTKRVDAQVVSDTSACIKSGEESSGFDFRVENLRNYLEKFNSPLAPYAKDLVANADENGLDYRLVPAISGVESTFGKNIPNDSYNAYGWANGNYSFTSWPDSISQVSETLKSGYIDKGAPTIAKIAKRYAPPSTTWGYNVKYFVSKIDTLPLNFDI
jgi:hypothetical protein